MHPENTSGTINWQHLSPPLQDRIEQWREELLDPCMDVALVHEALQASQVTQSQVQTVLQNIRRHGNTLNATVPINMENSSNDFQNQIFPGLPVRIISQSGKEPSRPSIIRGRIKEIQDPQKLTDLVRLAVEISSSGELVPGGEVNLQTDPEQFRELQYRRLERLLTFRNNCDSFFIEDPPPLGGRILQQLLTGYFPAVDDRYGERVGLPEGAKEKEWLDPAQHEAYRRAMWYQAEPILYIHGGPGTGKTSTIVEIIEGHIEQDRKVLLLSHSNKGAQVPMLKLREKYRKLRRRSLHVSGNSLDRVDMRLHGHRIRRGIMFPVAELSELRMQPERDFIEDALEEKPEYKDMGYAEETLLSILREEIGEIRARREHQILSRHHAKLKNRKENIEEKMEEGGVVSSTFGTFENDWITQELDFDVIIVDEATRMGMWELLQLLELSKTKQIIFVGDPLQLGNLPFSREDAEAITEAIDHGRGIDESVRRLIFSEYGETEIPRAEEGPFSQAILTAGDDPEAVLPYVFLDQNRRSLPNIVQVLSELIYDGKLHCGRQPQEGEHAGIVQWRDTAQLESQEKTQGTSKKNTLEADLIVEQVLDRVISGLVEPEDIAIIATYSSQARLIQRKIERKLKYSANKTKNRELCQRLVKSVATVDSFQGDERKIVMVSLTRSNTEGEVGFLEEQRRIGVAIGRAQDELYVYGDSRTVVDENTDMKSQAFFSQMRDLVEAHGQRIILDTRPPRPRQRRSKNRKHKSYKPAWKSSI